MESAGEYVVIIIMAISVGVIGVLGWLDFRDRANEPVLEEPWNVPELAYPFYACEGERVTCENGHLICTVARNIECGSMTSGDEFRDWRQPEPAKYTRADEIRCTVCNAGWYANYGHGQHIHFEDGWR